MDIHGSNQHRLTLDGRRDRAPHWSPDGRRIVSFSVPGGGGGRGNGVEDMWSIAATGGRPRHLASNAEGSVYSPDGYQIAFLRNYAIWSMRADGSHQRRLVDSQLGSEVTSLDWGQQRVFRKVKLAPRSPTPRPLTPQVCFFGARPRGVSAPPGPFGFDVLATEHRWSGDALQGPGSTSLRPHLAPAAFSPILRSS